MPRQREIPRINSVTIIYNGDKKSFDTFMEAMINDYLNSDSMSKRSNDDFIAFIPFDADTIARIYAVSA